jgi:hypothetical protein
MGVFFLWGFLLLHIRKETCETMSHKRVPNAILNIVSDVVSFLKTEEHPKNRKKRLLITYSGKTLLKSLEKPFIRYTSTKNNIKG